MSNNELSSEFQTMTSNEPIFVFTSEDRVRLLGKVINYIENIDEKNRDLTKYFTNNEIQVMAKQLQKCDIAAFLGGDNNIHVYDELKKWKNAYKNNEDMKNMFCGVVSQIRRQRVLGDVSRKLQKSMPESLTQDIGSYLSQVDRIWYEKALVKKHGGKQRTKKKKTLIENSKKDTKKNTKKKIE